MKSRLFVGMASVLFLVSQNIVAAQPVETQIKHVRRGAAVQVHMNDGRILEGKLVSSSGPSFELLEPDHDSVETIDCASVTAVNKVNTPPKQKKTWVVTALMLGGLLAGTGIAVAFGGTLY